jgi:hypothetical protein
MGSQWCFSAPLPTIPRSHLSPHPTVNLKNKQQIPPRKCLALTPSIPNGVIAHHSLIMSFRKIRPSFGDSSASTSNPSQSTSESTGSDPRRARGEKEIADSSNSSLSSKRRRVPESVTRNACLNCKKARAKVSIRLCMA